MKAFVLLLVALCVTAALTSRAVQAASQPVPATVYPPGAHISYRPALANAEMDCMWGFVCEGGLPNFHFETQDQLHRVTGWAQFAGVRHHGRTTMAFELFVSQYDPAPDEAGRPWSERAFLDLQLAIHAQRYHLDKRDAALLSTAPSGGTLLVVQRLGKQDLVVMACWSGTREVEGIASYDHQPVARQTAWTSLARQIRIAFQNR